MNIARLPRYALHCALLLAVAAAACEKVPLLAPGGSTITLTSLASAVPTNGTVQLIAQVIEPAGTPPHSGTHVIFTTTLGTIEPAEAETDINGRAVAMFKAGLSNGTATIIASSGGATVAAANALKIAVGNAAVGSLSVTASPTTLPASGGTSSIAAQVLDISGNVLPGVNVSFTTDTGAVGPSSSITNGNGVATTTLTATRTAKVTATAGIGTAGGTGSTGGSAQSKDVTVTVNVGPSLTLTGPTGTVVAGQPFTVAVAVGAGGGTGGTGAPVRSVVLNWGDGQQTAVGSSNATLAHVYFAPGTYTITATATDTNGDSSQATTAVVVQPRPLPTISLSATQAGGGGSTVATFTVGVAVAAGSNASIQNTHVDFGDGHSIDLGSQTGTAITFQHVYPSVGNYQPTATVVDTNGTTANAATTLILR